MLLGPIILDILKEDNVVDNKNHLNDITLDDIVSI